MTFWVGNASGWSSPYLLNAARSLYQSEYEAYAGVNIEVVGRNFDQSEFGATTATLVRLNNGSGGVYPETIASLNPYNVTFTVGSSAPLGTYLVQVSNDNGADWSSPSSGQTLTIVPDTFYDPHNLATPLNLGVSWIQNINWSNVINVTQAPYNLNPNATSGDESATIASAIDAAANEGGGVVYFPDGSYYSSYVHLAPNVVLEGQDEYGTKIYYDGIGGSSFIKSYSDNYASNAQPAMQLQGVARLSLLLANDNNRPDVFMSLGDDNISNAESTEAVREANRIFVSYVNESYGYTSGFASANNEVNDSAAGITYTGNWTYTSGTTAGDYDNDLHTTTTIGDSLQYTFTGTSIAYARRERPDRGQRQYLPGWGTQGDR